MAALENVSSMIVHGDLKKGITKEFRCESRLGRSSGLPALSTVICPQHKDTTAQRVTKKDKALILLAVEKEKSKKRGY